MYRIKIMMLFIWWNSHPLLKKVKGLLDGNVGRVVLQLHSVSYTLVNHALIVRLLKIIIFNTENIFSSNNLNKHHNGSNVYDLGFWVLTIDGWANLVFFYLVVDKDSRGNLAKEDDHQEGEELEREQKYISLRQGSTSSSSSSPSSSSTIRTTHGSKHPWRLFPSSTATEEAHDCHLMVDSDTFVIRSHILTSLISAVVSLLQKGVRSYWMITREPMPRMM